jgi:SAM-dependent methyltransferase
VKALLVGLWRRLRGAPGPPHRLALAVAIGLFIGCQPLYGLHLVLVLAVCLPLRLDALAAYAAANISNPLLAPFLVVAQVQVGAWLATGNSIGSDLERARTLGAAGFARSLALGALALGAALASLGFAVTWLLARGSRPAAQHTALEHAKQRARARFAGAPAFDRHYVTGKLELDPLFALLAAQPGEFGRALDVGCGRGQLAAFLLELGRVSRLYGFDNDARKIALAQQCVPEAEFAVQDAAAAQFPESDSVFVIDVLHYISVADQNRVLDAAARALAPGGRLFVRELDADPSSAGALRRAATRALEWLARSLGINRGRASHYRPAREIAERLSALGLCPATYGASDKTPFANVLIVGTAGASGSPAKSLASSGAAPSTLASAAKA